MSRDIHCMSIDSGLSLDIIDLEVHIEQLLKWLRYGKAVTKKELIGVIRHIRGKADHMEYELKKAGYEYMEVKE